MKIKNAIILAAGFGMRMVPINTEVAKGLIEINGEPLIERTILQLKSAGIDEIHIIVGYMKEKYEYLKKRYNVHLIENPDYALKNNLHSLKLALPYLSNSYIVPCDVWSKKNPFDNRESESWYMVSNCFVDESNVKTNDNNEIIVKPEGSKGNAMIGICYLTEKDAETVKERVENMCTKQEYDEDFWEKALFDDNEMIISANIVHCPDVVEINTYEQLREIDSHSNQLNTDAINVICEALNAKPDEVTDITVLKKGMTNRSFLFSCKGKKYIMRIPGEGTEQLINRKQEADVYHTIDGLNICDNISYINSENGYKITEFLEGARVCDCLDYEDVKKCMKYLRGFHEKKLKVDHCFSLYKQIELYESYWQGTPSVYKDYEKTKKNVLSLKSYIDSHAGEMVLTHIDAVPDNFLIVEKENGEEDIRLIDWEYAGMQDPHVDVAMFCIYSLYDREQIERLIDAYFYDGCTKDDRIKIYCYIAVCGMLWSNWCEYKRILGVNFGEYSIRQYQYAKDYYKIAIEEQNKSGAEE